MHIKLHMYICTYVEHYAWVASTLIDYFVYRLGDILGLHQAYNKSCISALDHVPFVWDTHTKGTSWSCPKLHSTR